MKITEIKELIKNNRLEEAKTAIKELIRHETNDELYYLLGNIYRKESNWQMALNNYYEAIDINPDSPATIAAESVRSILDYYNKDLKNP